MKKIAIFREELNGITDYDTLIDVCEDAERAQEIINHTLDYLTESEKRKCKIYAVTAEIDEEGEIDWDKGFDLCDVNNWNCND